MNTEQIAADLLALARHGRQLATTIASLEEELAEVKRRIRAALPIGEALSVDDRAVTVIPNRRWNEQQARAVIPAPLIELCTVSKLDSATAKKQLPPDLYAQCLVESGDPVVRGLG